ncbi:MAG TPA: multifunctional CCA addition/repair protein [Gammaproteobacteria bacterium]|nr:multifunctional CCA addition/repair protein [Gammaproteobacteria bacterium]HQZ87520.1 multifunctional CCA addition/repair protein [Gammaproteobacteria bacterium]
MQIYLVGGAVRDKLLGLPQRERDWVIVGGTPEALLAEGYKPVGKDFPVFLHPQTQEEYALARTERKTGKGYYGFECYASPDVTLEEDLSRRDLTINAMATTERGEIIDPFQGQADLKNKTLRHVSSAFAEDPVRILRVARFAARFAPLGFTVAPETINLMRSMVASNEVDELVAERVWQEMHRALGEADPTQFFLVLRACGALQRIWPALDKLWGIPQPEQHHPEIDTGIHVMMVLGISAKLSQERLTRFAALCHDLGKGESPPEMWPSHRGHEERGVPLIQAFCKRYRVPKEYGDLAKLVSRFHLHCHRVFELKPTTLLKTLERLDAFRQPERFEKFLLACEADARGRLGRETTSYPQADRMREALQVAKAVLIKPLIDAGLEGAALGVRLHQQRARAIEKAFD